MEPLLIRGPYVAFYSVKQGYAKPRINLDPFGDQLLGHWSNGGLSLLPGGHSPSEALMEEAMQQPNLGDETQDL